MNEVVTFGEYRLFRKIAEDAIGETWRAAGVSGGAIQRVVLLRLFNAPGLDIPALRTTLTKRAPLQEKLRNPHLAQGVDAGEVDGVPYLAYEYVPGKPLSTLIARSQEQPFPIPIEQALFVTERVAFGLTAASEAGGTGKRIVHGFLSPHWVMLSNEGEVKLKGIEAGPALAASLKSTDVVDEFGPYLSPEILAGAKPTERDDVFSLSALLFELLTGKKLAKENVATLIDSATLAGSEEPIPAAIRALLKSGTAAADQRIGEVLRWQHSLSRFIAEGEYSPTTFNLAFFMHTLFESEMEAEDEEIRKEAALASAEAAAQTAPVPVPAVGTGPAEHLAVPTEEELTDPGPVATHHGTRGAAKKGIPSWVWGAAAGILVVGGGLAWYFTTQQGSSGSLAQPVAEAPKVVRPEAPVIEAPPLEEIGVPEGATEPTQAELEQRLEALIQSRAEEMEASLRAKYEAQIEALRSQVTEAEEAEDDPVEVASVPDDPTPERVTESASANQPGTSAQLGGAGAGQASPTSTPPAESTPRAAGTTAPAAPAPAPAPVPAPPTVKLGDLVKPGAGVKPPKLTRRPEPRYPPAARRLNRTATVTLGLLVDENGDVIEVQQKGKKAGFGFDDAAVSAARRTKWSPAEKSGVRVKMWVDLKIQFQP